MKLEIQEIILNKYNVESRKHWYWMMLMMVRRPKVSLIVDDGSDII